MWLLETCSKPKNVLGRQIGVSTSLMKEPSMSYIVSITVLIFTFSCYSQHNYHDIHLLISFSDIIGSTTHACTHVYSSLDFTSTSTIPSYLYISLQWVLLQASYIFNADPETYSLAWQMFMTKGFPCCPAQRPVSQLSLYLCNRLWSIIDNFFPIITALSTLICSKTLKLTSLRSPGFKWLLNSQWLGHFQEPHCSMLVYVVIHFYYI